MRVHLWYSGACDAMSGHASGAGLKICMARVQVGDWDAVLDKCKAGRIQPSVLLYEDTQG